MKSKFKEKSKSMYTLKFYFYLYTNILTELKKIDTFSFKSSLKNLKAKDIFHNLKVTIYYIIKDTSES